MGDFMVQGGETMVGYNTRLQSITTPVCVHSHVLYAILNHWNVEETASRNELIILAKVLSQSQCALLRPADIN